MSDHNSILKALQKLRPLAEFNLRGTRLEWLDPKQTEPNQDEINTEIERQKKEFTDNQYQRDRADSYPAIGDQLDMLFHAIDAGKVDKTSDFYKSLKAVKDKYPKG